MVMVAITDIFTKSRYHSGKCIPVAFCSSRFQGTFRSQFRNGLIPLEHVTPGMVILAGLSAILNSAGMTGFQQESVGHDKDLLVGAISSIMGIQISKPKQVRMIHPRGGDPVVK